MTEASELEVFLGGIPVARIGIRGDQDIIELRLLDSYLAQYPRPVLGQQFIDDPGRPHRTRQRLPPFFSNLLPEGPLRELLAGAAGVHPDREYYLLRWLGEDLAGAVIVRPATESLLREGIRMEEAEASERSGDDRLRFSLAGVQLKFSAVRNDKGLVIPATGRGGDWIVKLPDQRYEEVPANEWSMMEWARRAGLDVPETHLLDAKDVQNIPHEVRQLRERQVYAIRRFDREECGRRIHIEDFAQVLGQQPRDKYKGNYETLGTILLALCGEATLRDFVVRLVFCVACGNADAHLKNWSLIYRDGFRAELAPVYDMVSTAVYPGLQDELALKLDRTSRVETLGFDSFHRLASRCGIEAAEMKRWLREAGQVVWDSWVAVRAELPISELWRSRIEERRRRLPLFRA